MQAETLVIAAGILNMLCGVLHLFFPKLLGWKSQLKSLNRHNQATMKILNTCLMLFWFMLGYVYIRHSGEMVATGLGRSLLVCMCIFWVIRAFVLQPVYLGVANRESVVMTSFFLLCLAANAVALFLA